MGLIIDKPSPFIIGTNNSITVKTTTLEADFNNNETFSVWFKSYFNDSIIDSGNLAITELTSPTREIELSINFLPNSASVGEKYKLEIERKSTGSKATTLIFITDDPKLHIGRIEENQSIVFVYDPSSDTTAKLSQYRIDIKKDNTIIESSGWKIASSNQVVWEYSIPWAISKEAISTYTIDVETLSNQGLLSQFKNVYEETPSLSEKWFGERALLNVRPRVKSDSESGKIVVTLPPTMRIYCSCQDVNGNPLIKTNQNNELIFEITKEKGYGLDPRLLVGEEKVKQKLLKLVKIYEEFDHKELNISSIIITEGIDGYTLTAKLNNDFSIQNNYSIELPYVAYFQLYRHLGDEGYVKICDIPAQHDYEKDENDELYEVNIFNYQDMEAKDGEDSGYALSQYKIVEGSDKTSGPAESNTLGKLEHIMLSDKDRILKIKYNPKISSFKTIIQEQKVDTIGGTYPFFFRNGSVNYKEIPLSGLLVYEDDHLFNIDIKAEDEFRREREFKRAVEEWLNNGQPKLLRTAAEGEFFVRIMNVSLTPIEALGRRLHSFSATAYEIAPVNNWTLKKYGFKNKIEGIEDRIDSSYYRYYPIASQNSEELICEEQIEYLYIGKILNGLTKIDLDTYPCDLEYSSLYITRSNQVTVLVDGEVPEEEGPVYDLDGIKNIQIINSTGVQQGEVFLGYKIGRLVKQES